MPYSVEKFNFNPFDMLGTFFYDDYDDPLSFKRGHRGGRDIDEHEGGSSGARECHRGVRDSEHTAAIDGARLPVAPAAPPAARASAAAAARRACPWAVAASVVNRAVSFHRECARAIGRSLRRSLRPD